MKFLRTVIVQDETIAADGSQVWDLPVNPVSHINLTIKCLNVTDEASIANILALVTNVEVIHRGENIYQLSAADLYAYDQVMLRNLPIALNLAADDNATRAVQLVIPFGRKLWDPTEAFPESKAGELQLRLTMDIATAEADGLIIQAEATELLDANPTRHLKCTTLASTPAATGQHDIDLPIRHQYAGVLIYSTTKPTGTAWTTTVDQVKLLADNTELNYSLTNWESLRGDLIIRPGHEPGHVAASGHDHCAHYAFLDFTPNNEDTFLVDSGAFSSFKIRVTAGDTEAIRVLPVELLSAAGR